MTPSEFIGIYRDRNLTIRPRVRYAVRERFKVSAMENEIREILRREGNPPFSLEKTRGGHFRVTLDLGGTRKVFIAPSTPSDHRSILNFRASIRRTLREHDMGPEKSGPRPHKHRRRKAAHGARLIPLERQAEQERKVFQLPSPEERRVKVYRWTFEKKAMPRIEYLNARHLAEILDLHPSRISQLVSEGVLTGDAVVGQKYKRRYHPTLAVKQYRERVGWYRDDLDR